MPLSGMTGFARTEGALGDWSWSVEARSVNGRNLEVRVRGPSGFDSLEAAARQAAQARFRRGQLNVTLNARRAESASRARVNTDALEALLAIAKPYVDRGDAAPPRFDGLLAVRGVLETAEAEEPPGRLKALETAMATSLDAALDGLKAARDGEGAALAPVLAGLIDRIETVRRQAEAEARDVPAALRARFAERIAALLDDPAPVQDRIVQEAAMLAIKADIREELDRLAAHVAAARELIAGEDAAGRRLDFLTQEFMREANTLCSKSASITLTALGLELKALIEQFREQVQNVE